MLTWLLVALALGGSAASTPQGDAPVPDEVIEIDCATARDPLGLDKHVGRRFRVTGTFSAHQHGALLYPDGCDDAALAALNDPTRSLVYRFLNETYPGDDFADPFATGTFSGTVSQTPTGVEYLLIEDAVFDPARMPK